MYLASHNVGPMILGRCNTKSQALKMRKASTMMISFPLVSSFAPKKKTQIEANNKGLALPTSKKKNLLQS